MQTYGVAALINATGTLSYKGAAYLGTLVFFASSAPSVCLSFLRACPQPPSSKRLQIYSLLASFLLKRDPSTPLPWALSLGFSRPSD